MTRLGIVVVAVLAGCGGGLGDGQKRLRTAVDAQQDDLNACYVSGLERDPNTAGTMQVVLHVKGGAVETMDIKATEVEDGKLQHCVRTALKKVALDPPPAFDFAIDYTLQFGGTAEDADDGGDAPVGVGVKLKVPKVKVKVETPKVKVKVKVTPVKPPDDDSDG